MKKRKDGRYQKKIEVEKDGKVFTKWIYGRTIAELNRKEMQFQADVANRDKPMFFDLRDNFLNHAEKTKAYNTYRVYRVATIWWSRYFGNIRADEITPLMVTDGLVAMRDSGKSINTLKAYFSVLQQLYAYANVLYNGFADPTRGVEMPASVKPAKKIDCPPKEVLHYVNDHVNDEFGFFPYLMLYSGLRQGEVLALRYEDCSGGLIHVSKTAVFHTTGSHVTAIQEHTKTSAGMREVPIFPQLEPYLSGSKTGYLFGGDHPLTREEYNNRWNRYVKQCAKACGGYHLRSHQLRHAFATACYNNGVDAKVCAAWLGHKDISTTLNIYTTLDRQKQAGEAKKMKSFF
ncbi:MAG: tyrosine-type recombinase/integrase [Lachnospiraceae bacterium]